MKKYPSLKAEFLHLVSLLQQQPDLRNAIGNDCYKIRLSIASKGKGKSGGARIITCVKVMDSQIHLLTIYDKSEQDSISERELKLLINQIG